MRDMKDWCISRKIWWGHQIPAWFCRDCVNEDPLTATVSDDQWPIPLNARPILYQEFFRAWPNLEHDQALTLLPFQLFPVPVLQ